MLTKPRTVCFCQPVASTISAKVTPLARFIIAITSAFLLLRDSFAPFCAWARPTALVGDFFAFPLVGATSRAGCAASRDRRATACQIRATASFRLVNFFTDFRSSKGATPAKLFQVSTRRDAGHSALSLASSFTLENDCDSSAPAGSEACAVMLLSESIVNVAIIGFSFGRLYLAVLTFITPAGNKRKRTRLGSGENLSKLRKRALESPGRACR